MKNIHFKVDSSLEIPIYKQIISRLEQDIGSGKLQPGDQLPSINKVAGELKLAPGTVIRAYKELRELGMISSKQGKGYFVSDAGIILHHRIFLLFDRISAFKEILYESFRNEFDEKTDIQVFFHHYDMKRFDKLIRENLGKFSHYVLMPHLIENVQKSIDRLPAKKIILIDNLPGYLKKTNVKAVCQDFYGDIYQALKQNIGRIKQYEAVNLSLSQSQFQFVPKGIQKGFAAFCNEYQINHKIIQSISNVSLKENELYIIFDDSELLNTLKLIQKKGWKLKENIGIISFDETPMKELLAGGISVLSTDFELMGKTAADLVKGKTTGQISNPFHLIDRMSF